MRIAIWLAVAVAVVATTPARAANEGFCADLRLMIRSVRDSPHFTSVTRASPPPALTRFRRCRANVHDFTDEVSCTMPLASGAPAVEAIAAEIGACLPATRRLEFSEARARGEAWFAFELLVIKIGQEGAASGANGDQARITVSIMG